MINEWADLGKDRLPVGQMTGDRRIGGGGTEWRGGQRSIEPLILANDCWMLTLTIAVSSSACYLFSYSALIDDTSFLNATATDSWVWRQVAIFVTSSVMKQYGFSWNWFFHLGFSTTFSQKQMYLFFSSSLINTSNTQISGFACLFVGLISEQLYFKIKVELIYMKHMKHYARCLCELMRDAEIEADWCPCYQPSLYFYGL